MKNLNQLFLGSVQVFLVLSGSMILSVIVGNIESLLSAVGQDAPKSYSILSGLAWVLLLLPMIWTFTMIRAQASEANFCQRTLLARKATGEWNLIYYEVSKTFTNKGKKNTEIIKVFPDSMKDKPLTDIVRGFTGTGNLESQKTEQSVPPKSDRADG